MSLMMWMCRFTLKERNNSAQLQELLGFERVSLVMKKDGLMWFGHLWNAQMMVFGSSIA